MNDSNLGPFASLTRAPTAGPGPERRIPPTGTRLLVLLSLAACGFPRPADLPGDAAVDTPDPGVVLQVSPAGDDANDGLLQPVKTLKHAIGLAAADARITKIVLASGTYSASSGETFPYTVPPDVAIVGPAGGGAVIAGNKTDPGLIVNTGKLQDLEFEGFMVAITVTGVTALENMRVRSSATAIQVETAGRLMVQSLDIAGTMGACASGIVLNGAASLTATVLSTRDLGSTLDSREQLGEHEIEISKATITGDPSCPQDVMSLAANGALSISDSILDGGANGIMLNRTAGAMKVTISDTILRNFKADALGGGINSGGSIALRMTGGELSGNGRGGGEFLTGAWTFDGVVIRQNAVFGVYLEEGELVMRNCMIIRNGDGVYVLDPRKLDLGTAVDPGNNILRDNRNQGLDYNVGLSRIDAEVVGNVWNPGVQGAGNDGRYSSDLTILNKVTWVVDHRNLAT